MNFYKYTLPAMGFHKLAEKIIGPEKTMTGRVFNRQVL
jgi:hypothetical protein